MPKSVNPQIKENKVKDFKGSIKRLTKEIKKYKKSIIVAIILSIFSSIIAILSPNRLSSLTDEITKGLMINEKKISELSKIITDNYKNNTFQDIDFGGEVISITDQKEFINIMSEIKEQNDREVIIENLSKLPDNIYKAIKPKMNIDLITKMTVILVILYLASNLFTYIQSIIMMNTGNKFAKELRKNISLKINKLPLSYFDDNQTGDVLSRVTNDVDNIAQATNQSATTLISSIILIFGSIIMMFYTNWILAISAILSSIIGFVFMIIALSNSQKYFIDKQESLGNLNGHIEEIYSSLNVVKVYNGQQEALKKFNKYNDKVCDNNKKSQFVSGLMMPMMMFVGNLGFVVVCIVGALLVVDNKISYGVIIAFIMYVRLFTNPMSQIAQGLTSLQTVAASSERVFEFIDEKEMNSQESITGSLDKTKVKGLIEFENVSFKYPKNKSNTIKNFTAVARPGQKIAIVGPTGAGKTTMVNLLMKFYEISSGDIKIDGVSINNLTRENISKLFTMVLQDTWLFEGTIKENIKYNRTNASDEDINKICEYIGLDHFIKTLPNGYDSEILDHEGISSGQKQLITIARGMVEDAPLLILDEATSNVDTRTEELVQKAMDKLTKGKTSFIIAHRLSTIINADLILVMKDGNIIEQGTHYELMEKSGFYSDLYNSQFEL